MTISITNANASANALKPRPKVTKVLPVLTDVYRGFYFHLAMLSNIIANVIQYFCQCFPMLLSKFI